MKKITALLLSIMIASCMTACAQKDAADSGYASSDEAQTAASAGSDSEDSSDVPDSSEEENADPDSSSEEASAEDASTAEDSEAEPAESEAAEIKPIAIPESGWKEDKIKKVIYVNGVNVCVPCKFADLGEGYEFVFDDNDYFGIQAEEAYVVLKYHGGDSIACSIKNCREASDVYDGDITLILDELEDVAAPSLSVNGFTLGMSREEMDTLLGFETTDNKAADGSGEYIASFASHDLMIKIYGNDELGAYRMFVYYLA